MLMFNRTDTDCQFPTLGESASRIVRTSGISEALQVVR
jgi:hypothetical protein